MSSAVECLRTARALLGVPERSTSGAYARDEEGRPCGLSEERAARFCAVGAVGRASVIAPSYVAIDCLHVAAGGEAGAATRYNDSPATTHADIVALFDRAIALAEAKEK